MYRTFYGLKEKPFALLTDSRFFYQSKVHQEILNALKQCILNKERMCLLTGDIGTGKTSLIRYLLEEVSADYNVGFLANTNFPAEELPAKILSVFHQSAGGGSLALSSQALYDYFSAQNGEKHFVLFIDDSQNLSTEAVKVLYDLMKECFVRKLSISIIISGEPALREILSKSESDSFSKFTDADFVLKNLSQDETAKYIKYRVNVAGGYPDLFDDTATNALFNSTGGIPRSINLLCDSALVYGYVDESKAITENIVNNVVNDRKGGRLFPALSKAEEIAKKRTLKENEMARINAEQELTNLKTEKESARLKEEKEARIIEEEELARLKAEEDTITLKNEEEARLKAEQELARLQEEEAERLKEEEQLKAEIESLRLQEEEMQKEEELNGLNENKTISEPTTPSDEDIHEEVIFEHSRENDQEEDTFIDANAINKVEKSRNIKPAIGAVAAVLAVVLGIALFSSSNEEPDIAESDVLAQQEVKKDANKLKTGSEENANIASQKAKPQGDARKKAELEQAKKLAEDKARKKAALKAEQDRKTAEAARQAAEQEKVRIATLKAKQQEEARKKAELEQAKKQAEDKARKKAALKAEQDRKTAEATRQAAEQEKVRIATLKAKQQEEARKKAELEQAKKQAEDEARKKAALKAEQDRKTAEAARQAAEQEKVRIATMKARQQEEARKKAELEQAKKQAEDEARKKAALKAEQDRKTAEAARQAAEQEKVRIATMKARQQEEARKKAELEQAKKQAEDEARKKAALKAEQDRKTAEAARQAAEQEKVRIATMKAKQQADQNAVQLQLKADEDTRKAAEANKIADKDARFKVVKVREQGSTDSESSDTSNDDQAVTDEATVSNKDFAANPCDGPAAKFLSTCRKRK